MKKIAIVAAVATLLAACASDPIGQQGEPEEEFGSSVRHMVRSQTFNPLAGKVTQPPAGMDGDKAAAALKAHRAEKPTRGNTFESPPITPVSSDR